MLINNTALIGFPILSLHVGSEIARISDLIIDPNSLKLIAFRLEGPLIRDEIGDILPISSVREFSRSGFIIDSIDEFVGEDEIVNIQKIIKLHFALPGLKVVTKSKAKLGKVSSYILNTASWDVCQIIVQRPVMKSFLDPELIISRQLIVEVNDYRIIVKDEHDKVKEKVGTEPTSDFIPNFINPFRKPDFAPEAKAKE